MRLLRTNKDKILVTIARDDGFVELDLGCVDWGTINFWGKDILSHELLSDSIGYVYPGSLIRGEIDDIMTKFMETKGLIIDLRCYPSDFIVFSLGKYLMPKPTEFVKFTSGSMEDPGLFIFGPTLKVGQEKPDYYKGKVVILINETTQSQAEYTTMALQAAPLATVIGSTTAGADGNVSEIYLPGKVRTMISGIGVYYPDGAETQRVGIVPDIFMSPTIEGIRLGEDELLQKAIDLIST